MTPAASGNRGRPSTMEEHSALKGIANFCSSMWLSKPLGLRSKQLCRGSQTHEAASGEAKHLEGDKHVQQQEAENSAWDSRLGNPCESRWKAQRPGRFAEPCSNKLMNGCSAGIGRHLQHQMAKESASQGLFDHGSSRQPPVETHRGAQWLANPCSSRLTKKTLWGGLA